MDTIFVFLLYIFTQFVLLILFAPFFDWLIKNIKAFFNWRKLFSIFQSYYDLNKLFKKELIINKHSSIITVIAPIFLLSIIFLLVFFVPVVYWIVDFNIIYFIYIFSLYVFFIVILWMDSSTYFGWLWVSRELFLLFLCECVILMMIAILYINIGSLDIFQIFNSSMFLTSNIVYILFVWCLAIITFFVIMAENTRFPFDNPATHLELTMIHEAMLLEISWPNLALLELASKIKMMIYLNLFISIFMSYNFGISEYAVLLLLWIIKMFIMVFLVAIVEVYLTKIRIFRYQEWFGLMLVSCIMILLFNMFI